MEEYITRMGLIQGQPLFPKNVGMGKKKVVVFYSRLYGELKGKIWARCSAEMAVMANRCGNKRQ